MVTLQCSFCLWAGHCVSFLLPMTLQPQQLCYVCCNCWFNLIYWSHAGFQLQICLIMCYLFAWCQRLKTALSGLEQGDSFSCLRKHGQDTHMSLLTCDTLVCTYCLLPGLNSGPYRRDRWSSFSWLRELSAPTEVAPAGSWLSWSITSRPLSSAIWWMRSSTCSWGVVSVIAELMESSMTWCRKEMAVSYGT